MPVVPITIKVDETVFFPVVRTLRAMSGVSVDFNLDEMTKPRNKRRISAPQEAAPAANGKPKLRQLLIALLLQGPQHLRVLKKAAVQADFSVTGIDTELYHLKKAGITESGGVGIHKLTDKAERELKGTPTPLLPAPAAKKRRTRLPKGIALESVISALQTTDGVPVKRETLAEVIVAAGGSKNSINGSINKAIDEGLVKRGRHKGFYELTAKGKNFKLSDQQPTGE